MALHSFRDEVFTIGSHEGFNATQAVIRRIVDNFNTLRANFNVPLKLGHDDDQPLTDGLPAIGWVDSLELDNETNPTTIFANYKDMPTIVFTAVKNKMYRSRSIELEDQYRGGKLYKNVLTAVALLGSKLPRVEKLSDLNKYFAKGADKQTDINKFIVPVIGGASVTTSGRMCFSVQTKPLGVATMTPEEILKMKQDMAALTTANAKLTTDNVTLAAEKEVFSKADADRIVLEAATKVTKARATVTGLLEDAVKDERITPALRETFSKVLGVSDDVRVVAIEVSDVEALVGVKKETFSKKSTASDGHGEGHLEDEDDDVSMVLSKKVFAHMEKSGNGDFSAATAIVLRANPKLASDYVLANGEFE